jgi:hypothetical protein
MPEQTTTPAPCIAVVGPANAGKTTLLHQLDHLLQARLKAVLVIPGSPDHTGRYLHRAPHQREDLKAHVKGRWTPATVDHICQSIDRARHNLELAILDFGGKHDDANDLMLTRCTHYLVVARRGDLAGADSWDAVCRRNGLVRIGQMSSLAETATEAPAIAESNQGWLGTFRYDATAGDPVNDPVMTTLADEIAALARPSHAMPYIDLHEPERWEERHIADVRGRADAIHEMAARTGVVVLGGVAPIWGYLAGLRCALSANPDSRIFFFDPKLPERLVEIPRHCSDGAWPENLLRLQWSGDRNEARLEFHALTEDKFLRPAAATSLANAPGYGEIPDAPICLWGFSPLWVYGTYARWLANAGARPLGSFDAALSRCVWVWL